MDGEDLVSIEESPRTIPYILKLGMTFQRFVVLSRDIRKSKRGLFLYIQVGNTVLLMSEEDKLHSLVAPMALRKVLNCQGSLAGLSGINYNRRFDTVI